MTTILKILFDISLHRGMKLDLSIMQKLDRAFDFPSRSFKSIHVGGTNGKGSTTLKIARSLQVHNKNIGLYTSPHISSVRERIEVDGKMITEEEMENHFHAITKIIEKEELKATFFEIMTMMAFLHFREKNVTWAVLEVGLGGRLDATNIVNPDVSVICSIGFDHMLHLGNSLEEIAAEKGGIIKEGIPLVLGPQANCSLLHKMAQEKSSPLHIVNGNFSDFEEENQAIAKRTLDTLPLQYSLEGLQKTPPCRFEKFNMKGTVILDVAHNPPATRYLLERLKKEFAVQKKVFLVGFSADKDYKAILDLIMNEASKIYLTKASHGRALSPNIAAEYLKSKNYFSFFEEEDIHKAFNEASKNDFVVVTGTFYIMREVRMALGLNEPKDPFSFLY